jgi:ATP-dependent RNA circularization protein (DNA/RNA ligase family)
VAIEFPKIETLFDRDMAGNRKVDVSKVRLPEFLLVKEWIATEKVDGTNVRVIRNEDGTITYQGRTDNAQMHTSLVQYLRDNLTAEKINAQFKDQGEVILFGEGYGPKIQACGGSYRKDVSFRLFDVRVGHWWLTQEAVSEIALALGVKRVPILGIIRELPKSADALRAIIGKSIVAGEDGGDGCIAEGIVCRTEPLLLMRNGQRLMWKLKHRDF